MRIILLTGKGGVGKTTTACATAVRLAERGTKTLLISTDPAHSVGDSLQLDLTDEPTEVCAGLWAVQVDTQRRFEDAWRDVRGYLSQLMSRAGIDSVAAEELMVLPGAEELLALLAVHEYARHGDWDVLVVDCASTAQTLRLLALPEALGWYLAKVFPVQRRLVRGMRPLVSLLGRGASIPPDELFGALLALAEELAELHTLLSDASVTSVRLVLTPESMVLAESRRTFTALSLYGYRVDEVVLNRVAGDEWPAAWVAAQQDQRAAVRESFVGVPIRELAQTAAEPVGLAALQTVAGELYGPLPGDDPARLPADGDPITVRPEGDGYLLVIPLPLANRESLQLARVDDDLVVTVGATRRVLALPSVLRRCTVSGGGFVEEELRVRFRPDPTLWPTALDLPAGDTDTGTDTDTDTDTDKTGHPGDDDTVPVTHE